MEIRKLTCIGCPMGCALSVTMEGKEVKSIEGYTCKRGKDYAAKEVTNPRRIVTSTVRISQGVLPVVSVKTKEDISKEKILDCMHALDGIQVTAPVRIGDVIIDDIAGTGVALVATKNVEAS